MLIENLHAFYGVGALLGPTITTTGSKTRLATHLPGLCWGCGADGCRHALGSYVQPNDCAVAAPGTDARKFTSSAGHLRCWWQVLLLVYVGTGFCGQLGCPRQPRLRLLQVQRQCLLGRADNWTFEHGAPWNT